MIMADVREELDEDGREEEREEKRRRESKHAVIYLSFPL